MVALEFSNALVNRIAFLLEFESFGLRLAQGLRFLQAGPQREKREQYREHSQTDHPENHGSTSGDFKSRRTRSSDAALTLSGFAWLARRR